MVSPVYYGSSMYPLFKAGERLVLECVSFEQLTVGDVIIVKISGDRQYVHRVIEKNALYAVTMGDNNPTPDEFLVTADCDFKLVTGVVDASGIRRKVAGGKDGMALFARSRRKRWFRRMGSKVLCRCERCFFWRKTLQEKRIFGQEICYYSGDRAVARRSASGRVVYASWRDRLRYQLPEE